MRELANKIYTDLNEKGAGLGDMSIIFIEKSIREYNTPMDYLIRQATKLTKEQKIQMYRELKEQLETLLEDCSACSGSGRYCGKPCGACDGTGKESIE